MFWCANESKPKIFGWSFLLCQIEHDAHNIYYHHTDMSILRKNFPLSFINNFRCEFLCLSKALLSREMCLLRRKCSFVIKGCVCCVCSFHCFVSTFYGPFFSFSFSLDEQRNGQFQRANMFCTFFVCSTDRKRISVWLCHWLRMNVFRISCDWHFKYWIRRTFQPSGRRTKREREPSWIEAQLNVRNHCTQRNNVAGIYTM